MMNELVDAQNFNFLDIHTYIYIHSSLYLPSDFRIAYVANISKHLTIR